MGRLIIFGAGGFCRELIPIARLAANEVGIQLALAVDGTPGETRIFGLPVIGSHEIDCEDRLVLAVGDSARRQSVAARFPDQRWESLIHPTALIGEDVVLQHGATMCAHSMITASARIGRHFQCNVYSYVAHDCRIGDFVTFAPRVSCNGNVWIEDGAYIGTGAVIRNGTSDNPLVIGAGATVGMGAVVTRSVPAGAVVVGNPARDRNAGSVSGHSRSLR